MDERTDSRTRTDGADARTRLLGAAVKLVCQRGIVGVDKILRPDDLAEQASRNGNNHGCSRVSIYRQWPRSAPNALAVDLARHVTDPLTGGVTDDLTAAEDVYGAADHMGAHVGVDDQQALFIDVLASNFERQFDADEMVVGWVLHGVALTSSPLWRGEAPDDALIEAGRAIVAARGAVFEHIADIWAGLLSEAMAAFGRRPRSGYTVESIVKVMHSQSDGALLHMFVDPELNDPNIADQTRTRRRRKAVREAAEAMVHLAWAYSEPGSLADPRRPASSTSVEDVFGGLVDAAARLYTTGDHGVVEPGVAAEAADLPVERARALFPTAGDLADSVLRRLVAPAGPRFSTAGLAMVSSVLARLTDAARSHPQAFAIADAHPPTHPDDAEPFLEELTANIARALQPPKVTCSDPRRTAQRVVRLACEGDQGWRTELATIAAASKAPIGTA